MNYAPSPVQAQSNAKASTGRTPRRRFSLSMLLGGAGGLGLLACIACCTLPILGAIGIGSGAMAFFEILEPLSAGLLALAAIVAVVTFVRLRRKRCATPASQGASCSVEGSCRCGPAARRLSGAAER